MAESKSYYVEEDGKEIKKWYVKLADNEEVAIAQKAGYNVQWKEIKDIETLQKASDIASSINRQRGK